MPKTERELLCSIADKIGGKRGKRVREKLGKKLPVALESLLEKPLSDEEFAALLIRMETSIIRYGCFADVPPLFGEVEKTGEKRPTWWQAN